MVARIANLGRIRTMSRNTPIDHQEALAPLAPVGPFGPLRPARCALAEGKCPAVVENILARFQTGTRRKQAACGGNQENGSDNREGEENKT